MSNDKDKEKQTTSSDTSEPLTLNLGEPHKGLEGSNIGTIFVNGEYRIKSIVSTVTELINLSSFDKDLDLKDFARQLEYEEITDDINRVLEKRDVVKKEVEAKGGRCYLIELRPYIKEGEIEGVVVTFVDITELKETEKELKEKVEKIKELQRQIIGNDVSERWRIGQFLHDDLGQTLVSAEFMLKNLRKKVAGGEDVEEEIGQLINVLSQSMTEVRNLSHEIVPVDIEEKGIAYAFKNFARQLENSYDIHCELEYDSTVDRINNHVIATHLYRIAHEATKNAALHGEADKVKITLTSDEEYLHLEIKDNGTGFPDAANIEGGMGINIMRHRMELIGGTLEVRNTPDSEGTGAIVYGRLPIAEI